MSVKRERKDRKEIIAAKRHKKRKKLRKTGSIDTRYRGYQLKVEWAAHCGKNQYCVQAA
jgi:hypothetical protein